MSPLSDVTMCDVQDFIIQIEERDIAPPEVQMNDKSPTRRFKNMEIALTYYQSSAVMLSRWKKDD